jgi:hypothetical protein
MSESVEERSKEEEETGTLQWASYLMTKSLVLTGYLWPVNSHEPVCTPTVGNVGKRMDVRAGCTTRALVQQKLTQNKQVYSVRKMYHFKKIRVVKDFLVALAF